MSNFKKLSLKEGSDFMENVRNFFFKSISIRKFDFGPFGNEETADCAEFHYDPKTGLLTEILFFVNDKKLNKFLLKKRGSLYLFGAYNQINVCRMRSKGTVRRQTNYQGKQALTKRLCSKITKRTKGVLDKLTDQEAENRFEIIKHGKLFCFYPQEYSYLCYTRG